MTFQKYIKTYKSNVINLAACFIIQRWKKNDFNNFLLLKYLKYQYLGVFYPKIVSLRNTKNAITLLSAFLFQKFKRHFKQNKKAEKMRPVLSKPSKALLHRFIFKSLNFLKLYKNFILKKFWNFFPGEWCFFSYEKNYVWHVKIGWMSEKRQVPTFCLSKFWLELWLGF